MFKTLAIIIPTLLFITGLQAQVVIINENCTNAYSEILSLKFEDAKKSIEKEKQRNPQNIFIYYLENYMDFLEVTISEDEDLFESYKDSIPHRIEEIKKLSDTSRFKKYFIGNMNLQWATTRVKFGEYATAAFEINRAYRLLEENNNSFPEFFPNSITLGVLHIIIGIVPDSYSWILNLISMEGSVIQGQNELKESYNECQVNHKYSFLSDEILFYMGMVGLNLNPDPEFAGYLISRINKTDNTNLILSYLAINAMMKTGKNNEALNMFSSINKHIKYYPFYYLDYLHGDCFIRKLETENARKYYLTFLQNFNGQNYIKDAYQKLAWISLIEGDTSAYRIAMRKVLTIGTTNIDADKSAKKAANMEILPNVDLLKCRLLFDGGYYNKARDILLKLIDSELSHSHLVEKNYRMGRISHQVSNYTDAKIYYGTTIETGSLLPEYFAANAALKLGNIYEMENDPIRAAHYYNICLNLDFDEYRNSIRGKAKQGLKRVKSSKISLK